MSAKPTTKRPRVTLVYVPEPVDLTRIKPGPATDRAAAAIRELARPQLEKQRATEGDDLRDTPHQ